MEVIGFAMTSISIVLKIGYVKTRADDFKKKIEKSYETTTKIIKLWKVNRGIEYQRHSDMKMLLAFLGTPLRIVISWFNLKWCSFKVKRMLRLLIKHHGGVVVNDDNVVAMCLLRDMLDITSKEEIKTHIEFIKLMPKYVWDKCEVNTIHKITKRLINENVITNVMITVGTILLFIGLTMELIFIKE